MDVRAYRLVLGNRPLRGLLRGMGVSALGDGLSMVTVAWLAVRLAPRGHLGLFVGVAVAAYSLPAAAGAVGLGRLVGDRPARELALADCALRTCALGVVAALSLLGGLSAAAYVALLAVSSLMASWGTSGRYTLLGALAGPQGRLAANAAAGAQSSATVIVGPALAGVLLAHVAPGWLLAFDACSYAVLALDARRTPREATQSPASAGPGSGPGAQRRRRGGVQLLRGRGLLGTIAVTWVFFFLYGPVEDALPVFVARHGHGHAELLGLYWSAFGIGALVATVLTGALRIARIRLATLLIIAGWGACLVPFAFAPVAVTVVCFAIGGLVYGPFIPLTYSILQALAPPAQLPPILAARSAVTTIAGPLGTAVGGPLIAGLGAAGTLTASGGATLALALVATVCWRGTGVGAGAGRIGEAGQ